MQLKKDLSSTTIGVAAAIDAYIFLTLSPQVVNLTPDFLPQCTVGFSLQVLVFYVDHWERNHDDTSFWSVTCGNSEPVVFCCVCADCGQLHHWSGWKVNFLISLFRSGVGTIIIRLWFCFYSGMSLDSL